MVVSVALIAYFELALENFLTNDNLQTVSQFVAAPVIIACGEIMLLICREINLSVGQVFALAPFIMEQAQAIGLPVVTAIAVALAASALIGLAIGLITIGLKVPSFITTLGMLFLVTGVTLTISRGFPANTPGGPVLTGHGGWGYSEIVWAFLIVAVMHVVLRQHPLGPAHDRHRRQHRRRRRGRDRHQPHQDRQFRPHQHIGRVDGLLEAFRVGSTDPLAGGSNIMFLGVASG